MCLRDFSVVFGLWCVCLAMSGQELVAPSHPTQPSPASREAVALPDGVWAEWDLAKAFRESTPTRERICLNGLWRWQPATASSPPVPSSSWGYFKVPGSWPGVTDYMMKDSQTVHSHSAWRDVRLGGITAAWYEREFTTPADWTGRRVAVSFEYLNSYAEIYLDGNRVGEIRYPGGEVELDCRPGRTIA